MKHESFSEGETQGFICEMGFDEFTDLVNRPLGSQASKANEQYVYQTDPAIRKDRGGSWYGAKFKSLKDPMKVLTQGWKDGAARISEMSARMANEVPAAKSRKMRRINGPEGYELRIDKAIEGDWDRAFVDQRREMRTGGVTHVTLSPTFGGNCDISPEEMFWAGVPALVVADLLEGAGYSVRIVANKISRGDNGRNFSLYRTVLKEYGDPLRIDALASILCHAGIYRTYGFRQILEASWDVGYGLACTKGWLFLDHAMESIKAKSEICSDEDEIRLNLSYDREGAIQEIARLLKLIQAE